MKKLFASLMLGFGAALGVFVALAMPPGGWGVAVGVGLGLLGCIPLLLVMMMLVGRGRFDRRPRYDDEPQQPIIIIQPPAMPQAPAGYEMFAAPAGYGYAGYMEAPEHYPLEQPRYARPQPEQGVEPRRLPSRRRRALEHSYYRSQPDYYQLQEGYAPEYYNQPEPAEEYNAYYYDTPQPQPEQYDAYYGPAVSADSGSGYDYAPVEEIRSRPRPARRPVRSAQPRKVASYEDAVEADYRTIGENE